MATNPLKKRAFPKLKLTFRAGTLKRTHPLWPEHPVPIVVAFTEEEKPCPFVIPNGEGKIGKISAQLSSLYLAKLEILKCGTILGFLIELEESQKASQKPKNETTLIAHSLFDSALVWYSKVFISSDDGRIKLDPQKTYEGNHKHIFLHNEIIELRHKLIAHQTKMFEDAIPFAALNPDESRKEIVEIYYRLLSPDLSNSHYIKSLKDMTAITTAKITSRMCWAEDRLLDELNSLGIDNLYEQAIKFRAGQQDEDKEGSVLLLEDELVADNFETYIRHHQ